MRARPPLAAHPRHCVQLHRGLSATMLQLPCTAAQRRHGRPRAGAHAGQEGEAFLDTVLCGERIAFRSKATGLIEGLESPHRTFQDP